MEHAPGVAHGGRVDQFVYGGACHSFAIGLGRRWRQCIIEQSYLVGSLGFPLSLRFYAKVSLHYEQRPCSILARNIP
jgi:hypothetical protein